MPTEDTTPHPAADTAPRGVVVTEPEVDPLDAIEGLVGELTTTSPSGVETIAAEIKRHLATLRGGRGKVFATRHESLVADDTLSGGGIHRETEVPRSGVALPAGVSIADRSEDGEQPPVPVAPAAPADVDEALKDGKSVASPVVVQPPIAPVQTGVASDAQRKTQDDKAEQERQTAKLQAERDEADRERAAAEERARLARVVPEHKSPNPDTPPNPKA